MAQIVPGTNFGERFGTGLGQGLNELAERKLGELQSRINQNKAQQAWASILPKGTRPDFIAGIAAQPPEIQKAFLDRFEGLNFGLGSNNEAQIGGTPLERKEMEASGQPTQPGETVRATQPQEALSQLSGLRLGPSKEERKMRHEEKLVNLKANQKERAERFKATADVRHAATLEAEAARNELHDIERLEELSHEGKLDTPGYVEFLNRIGLDIPALMNPESQEFEKIAQSFTRNAKNYYGGRVSNFEIQQFLKTIPNLSQSPQGRARVIANLKYLNRAKGEHFKTLREVIKENEGIPPFDLEEQVYERKSPRLDKLAEQFKKDLAKPTPPAQNRLVTALQAILGTGAGKAGSLAKTAGGALAGAKIGARLGPIGTAAGAGIGGILGAGGLRDLL